MRVPESMSETEYLMALDQLAPTAPDKLRHHLFNQAITIATGEGAMEEARGLLVPVTDLACIHTHTCTHTHLNAQRHMNTCTHTHTETHTHTHTNTHRDTHPRTNIHTHTYLHRHTHTHTY